MALTEAFESGRLKDFADISYGNYRIIFPQPLTNRVYIRHICEKLDTLVTIGTPFQLLCEFKELCNYLDIRGILYELKCRWYKKGNIKHNIIAIYMFYIKYRKQMTYNKYKR